MVQVFGLYVLPDNECAMLIHNCVVGCYETTQNISVIGNNVFHSKVYMYLYISTDKGLTLFYVFLVKPISDAIYETGLCQRGVKFFK